MTVPLKQQKYNTSDCDNYPIKWFCNVFTGKFINVVAKWPGSTHDSHIFRTSAIGQDIEGTGLV